MSRHYSGPAEALLAVVKDDVLAGRGAGYRRLEADFDRVVAEQNAAGDIRLAIAHFCRAGEIRARRAAGDPVRTDRRQAGAVQGRMIGALDDDERIAREVLGGHEPGRAAGIRAPADAEAAALPDRVALEAAVTADDDAPVVLDRARAAGQPAADEIAERALADEADPGRITLVRDRQAAVAGDFPHLRLAQAAHGKFAAGQLPRVECVQEVTLVLVAVYAAQQAAAGADAGVVARRKALRAESPRILEADAELHLAVAEDVGIRRAPGRKLGEEMREHALAVLRLEACAMQRNAELRAHAARILEVGRARAVAVVVVPVRHEQALDAMSRIEEQGGRHRRVDAAREPDDDVRHGISPPPCGTRRRRAPDAGAARANGASRAGNRRSRPSPAGCGVPKPGPRARGGRARAYG